MPAASQPRRGRKGTHPSARLRCRAGRKDRARLVEHARGGAGREAGRWCGWPTRSGSAREAQSRVAADGAVRPRCRKLAGCVQSCLRSREAASAGQGGLFAGLTSVGLIAESKREPPVALMAHRYRPVCMRDQVNSDGRVKQKPCSDGVNGSRSGCLATGGGCAVVRAAGPRPPRQDCQDWLGWPGR